MMRRVALLALGLGCLLPAADGPRQKVEATHTERMDLPPGGGLRFKNSVDELQIEGWERPEVEITTIKSTKDLYDAGERAKGQALLDRVRVVTEKKGDEITVTTSFPHASAWARAVYGEMAFNLLYQVKVPRGARLDITHGEGEAHVAQVTGDIHATVRMGTITLSLPAEKAYDIDALSRVGSVTSDFPGRERAKLWFLGHQFAGHPATAASKLYLRVGFGDIVILKTRGDKY